MKTVKGAKKDVTVSVKPIGAVRDLSTLSKKSIPVQKGTKAEVVKKFKEATKSTAKGRDKYGFLNGSKAQLVWNKLIEGVTAKDLEKVCASPSALKHIIAEFKKPIGKFNHSRLAVLEIKDGKMKIVKFEFPVIEKKEAKPAAVAHPVK